MRVSWSRRSRRFCRHPVRSRAARNRKSFRDRSESGACSDRVRDAGLRRAAAAPRHGQALWPPAASRASRRIDRQGGLGGDDGRVPADWRDGGRRDGDRRHAGDAAGSAADTPRRTGGHRRPAVVATGAGGTAGRRATAAARRAPAGRRGRPAAAAPGAMPDRQRARPSHRRRPAGTHAAARRHGAAARPRRPAPRRRPTGTGGGGSTSDRGRARSFRSTPIPSDPSWNAIIAAKRRTRRCT